MLMVNRGEVSVSLAAFGIEGRLEPGKSVELPDGYCLPRLYLNRSRQPSIVEEVCPALQPANPAEAAEVKKTPAAPLPVPPSPEVEAAADARAGRPPAVAALLAQGRAEARAATRRRVRPSVEAPGTGGGTSEGEG